MTPPLDLVAFRRALHRRPEVSGEEEETAATVAAALRGLGADCVVKGLGGHGVLAVFAGAGDGPTVMLRAELDALPIPETSGAAHASEVAGKGHLCGHDGHSTILLGVAQELSRQRPARGRAVLLFQPAEEDGSGAAAVLADPGFAPFRPDWAFALHNMPGLPLGAAAISAGPANCASVGLKLRFHGRTAHAATPETGASPVPALLALIPALDGIAPGGPLGPGFRRITVTHVRVGEPTFGIAPGEGSLFLTLRCLHDAQMADLKSEVVARAEAAARAAGVALSLSWHDDFAACANAPEAAGRIEAALRSTGTPFSPSEPMLASEDFGRFGHGATRSAMFLLGAGEDHPALHDPRYDFPDAVIPTGVAVYCATLRDFLG